MSAVKRSETHSRWSLTIHSSSIVHWSSASVVATRAATNGPKTTRADKQHLGLKETLKCTIPMQCMQKDNLVRNPFLVECSYLWESIYQFLWQRHQTMFNLDFKDFGHRSVWQGSPGGRECACVSAQKVDNAVTSLLDLEPVWSIWPIWRESACTLAISTSLCLRRFVPMPIGNSYNGTQVHFRRY